MGRLAGKAKLSFVKHTLSRVSGSFRFDGSSSHAVILNWFTLYESSEIREGNISFANLRRGAVCSFGRGRHNHSRIVGSPLATTAAANAASSSRVHGLDCLGGSAGPKTAGAGAGTGTGAGVFCFIGGVFRAVRIASSPSADWWISSLAFLVVRVDFLVGVWVGFLVVGGAFFLGIGFSLAFLAPGYGVLPAREQPKTNGSPE